MTEQERAKIVSEEYADLIIDYRKNPLILEGIPNSTVQIMNEAYAVIYVPVSQLVGESVGLYGYTAAPNLYGLASEVALEASKVPELREIETLNLRGAGVLVGIVDTGINYTLPVFKKVDGTSKVTAIWDQTILSENFPSEANFGTEYRFEQINEAIRATNPLDIVPSLDENGHGTMLAAVAAGTELSENDFYGVAPEVELVVVKLRQAKTYLRNFFVIPEGVTCFQENAIMWGVQYCIQVARQLNRPIAICIGVGSSQGTHDWSSPLSTLVSMMAGFPKTGIVICAGNEGNLGRHFNGNIDPSIGNTTVELNVGENDSGFTMELWGDAPGIYSIDILSPSGEYIPRIMASLRVRREIAFIFEETLIYVEYHTVESGSGDQLILIRFRNISSGIWKLTVYGQGDLATGFHIWLPMGDMISRDTYFVQADIYTTLLEPGTASLPLTVTAYNPMNNSLYTNASRGYTRSNDIKPELAAPGVNYLAPDLNGGFINYTGTGVAAAHTTGILALILEWGVVLGNQPNINTVEMKNYLIRGARRSSNLSYPNRDWGYGILDVYNAYNVFRLSQ